VQHLPNDVTGSPSPKSWNGWWTPCSTQQPMLGLH